MYHPNNAVQDEYIFVFPSQSIRGCWGKGSLKLFFSHVLHIGYLARSLLITLYATIAFFACLTEVF